MTRLRTPGGAATGLVILDRGLGALVTIGGACVVSGGGDTCTHEGFIMMINTLMLIEKEGRLTLRGLGLGYISHMGRRVTAV